MTLTILRLERLFQRSNPGERASNSAFIGLGSVEQKKSPSDGPERGEL